MIQKIGSICTQFSQVLMNPPKADWQHSNIYKEFHS